MKSTVLFCALFALAFGQGPRFETMDKNGDGTVLLQEMQAFCLTLDNSGDGNIDLQEFTAGDATPNAAVKAQFTYLDSFPGNPDQVINCNTDSALFFRGMDADDDGRITRQEFDAASAGMRQAIAAVINPAVGK